MNNTIVSCAFQIYKIKTNPLASCSDAGKFGWEAGYDESGVALAPGGRYVLLEGCECLPMGVQQYDWVGSLL